LIRSEKGKTAGGRDAEREAQKRKKKNSWPESGKVKLTLTPGRKNPNHLSREEHEER